MCTACALHVRVHVHRMCVCMCTACAPRVQGPCAENQLVLARSCVCENAMPLLEFLLALQLSGGQADRGRPTPLDAAKPWRGRRHESWSAKEARPQGWAGHDPLSMAQLLEAALCRAEDAAGRDAVAKFVRELEPQS